MQARKQYCNIPHYVSQQFHNIPIARGSFGASSSLVPSWWPTPGRFGMNRPNRLKPVNPVNAEVLEFLGASLCWLRCLESGYLPGRMGWSLEWFKLAVQEILELSILKASKICKISIISRYGFCALLFSAAFLCDVFGFILLLYLKTHPGATVHRRRWHFGPCTWAVVLLGLLFSMGVFPGFLWTMVIGVVM